MSSSQVILDQVYADNPSMPIVPTDSNVTLSNLQVLDAPTQTAHGGRDTSVTLNGVTNQGYQGSATVFYKRIALNALQNGSSLILIRSSQVTSADLLAAVNSAYGTSLTSSDIVVEALPGQPASTPLDYTLQSSSFAYEGNLSIQLVKSTDAATALSIYNKVAEAWDLQETSGDSIGGKQGLVLSGAMPIFTNTGTLAPATFSHVRTIDTNARYLRTNPLSNLGISGTPAAISMWWHASDATVNTTPTAMAGIWGRTNGSAYSQLTLRRTHTSSSSSNRANIGWTNQAGADATLTGSPWTFVSDNSTAFVVAVRDDQNLATRLYNNASSTYNGMFAADQVPTNAAGAYFGIGATIDGGTDAALGSYAGVWVYHDVPTADEITWLYNGGNGRTFAQLKTFAGIA